MSLWSHSEGDRPHTVTVYEREERGIIYARAWNAKARKWHKVSLGHRDKKRAKAYARAIATKLEQGGAVEQKVTLAQVFAEYLQHQTPTKVRTEQQADERRAELWKRFLGNTGPYDISSAQWKAFIAARSSGAIDSRGNPVPEDDRKSVRARSVEGDCNWLWLVFNWAKDWKLSSERFLMRENPVRGFSIPREENPLRPVATDDRFEIIRAISDQHLMEVRPDRKRRIKQRSYLSELLDLANGTGQRISAICKLRFDDLRLNEGPHGSIRWPAETDKKKREKIVPMSPTVRAAIDRILAERPGIGAVPLFPSPTDPTKPISRHLADSWLRSAEIAANLPKLRGGMWHPYRRKWATARKHLPDKDVMEAGGWRSLEALKKSYQHADPNTMLAVVMNAGELRAVK